MTAASTDDSQPSQDLAIPLAQPQSELAEVEPSGIRNAPLKRALGLDQSHAAERHPSLITAQAVLNGEQIRGEAELVLRRAELDAEFIRRRAELDADQRRLDFDKETFAERKAWHHLREADKKKQEVADLPDRQAARTAPRRVSLMSAPALAIAVLAALTSGLWHRSPSSPVSLILASAAAAFAVAYSATILISVVRLAFSSYRSGPHPGAATALHLLVGIGSARRRRVPPE
jgi:hypothetical protein